MRRRAFLRAIAAAVIATPLAPLLPKALTWREGQGLFAGAEKVYPSYLYLTTPFPSILSEDDFMKWHDVAVEDFERLSWKIDWPLTVHFDKDTMARITREQMLRDMSL